MFNELYKIYSDLINKKLIFINVEKQNPSNYDEISDASIYSSELGENLITFMELDFEKIDLLFKNILDDELTIDDFFYQLENFHEYFSCYSSDFARVALADNDDSYYDKAEWNEPLNEYYDDFKDTVHFVNRILRKYIDNCLNNSLSLAQNYLITYENEYKYSYTSNVFYSYPSTIECLIDNEHIPYTRNDYRKLLFKRYIDKNHELINIRFNEEKILYNNGNEKIHDDYNEKGAFYNEYDSIYNDKSNLTFERFLQSMFIDYSIENESEMDRLYLDYLSSHSMSVVECLVPFSIKDILSFEFINIIKSNTKIKMCINCGKYFVSSGDYDTKYCNRIFKDGLSCKVVGGRKATYEKIENTPELKLYDRFYKRYKARIRNGKMTENEFNTWNETAKSMRNKCIDNELSIEVFSEWLNSHQ